MKDDMAMKKAAMDLLGKLSSVDLSKAKHISVSVDMGGQHMMPDGEMMDDDEMPADSEESSGMKCADCGDTMMPKGKMMVCPSCGYKESMSDSEQYKKNPDKDVEGSGEYKKDTAKVRKQEYGM
jgi:Zn finger protein HypA/HybF involved in hydrogenase expression